MVTTQKNGESKEAETLRLLVDFYNGDSPSLEKKEETLVLSWENDKGNRICETFSLKELVSAAPELSKYFKKLLSLEDATKAGAVQATLLHWHKPGINYSQTTDYSYFVHKINKFIKLGSVEKTVVVDGFLYRVKKLQETPDTMPYEVRKLSGGGVMYFDELEKIYPGAYEKLRIGISLELDMDTLFRLVTEEGVLGGDIGNPQLLLPEIKS